MKTIEARLEGLETHARNMIAVNNALISRMCFEEAEYKTLHSIVVELCAKSGISKESFDHHYAMRHAWWTSRVLEEYEDADPGFASQLDQRSSLPSESIEQYPPLFSDSHPGND